MPRIACVCRSMNPGETTAPFTSMVLLAGALIDGAISTIVSPRMARSARYHGFPVPSTMRALRSTRSYGPSAACAAVKHNHKATTIVLAIAFMRIPIASASLGLCTRSLEDLAAHDDLFAHHPV